MVSARHLGAVLALLAAAGCYEPAVEDCKIRCAADNTCPHDLECENDFCRPKDHEASACACIVGETRACGVDTGSCRAGVQTCTETKAWSACVGEIQPSPEVCDNRDNDCNGMVDDAVQDPPLCERQKGVCVGAVHACVDGKFTTTCTSEYGPEFETLETKCDALDNDCDGATDARNMGLLVPASDGFALVGLDGGFALAWGVANGGGRSYSMRFYDADMNPIGAEKPLGSSATPSTLWAAANGTRAWFLWQHTSATQAPRLDEASGAMVDLANPGAGAIVLSGVLQPNINGVMKFGANANGLVAAWPADGGVGISEWTNTGAGPSVRYVRPSTTGFAQAYEVGISSGATTVTMASTFYTDDAGSTDFVDALYTLSTGATSPKYVAAKAAILDTPKGTSAVYDGYCDYDIFMFGCHKSFIIADFNVNSASGGRTEVRTASPGVIHDSHAAPTSVDWAASWVERNELWVGTPSMTGTTMRPTRVPTPGLVPLSTRIANAGRSLSAVAFTADPNVRRIHAMLVCAP